MIRRPRETKAPEDGGEGTNTIRNNAGGTQGGGGDVRCGVKKEEDKDKDDPQNSIPATTTPLPAASSPIVPDRISSSSSCSGGTDRDNTDWRPYTNDATLLFHFIQLVLRYSH